MFHTESHLSTAARVARLYSRLLGPSFGMALLKGLLYIQISVPCFLTVFRKQCLGVCEGHYVDMCVHSAHLCVHGADGRVHGADARVHGADVCVHVADVHGADVCVHGADVHSADVHGADVHGADVC